MIISQFQVCNLDSKYLIKKTAYKKTNIVVHSRKMKLKGCYLSKSYIAEAPIHYDFSTEHWTISNNIERINTDIPCHTRAVCTLPNGSSTIIQTCDHPKYNMTPNRVT